MDPAQAQEPDRVSAWTIALVGLAVVALTAALVVVAWLLVVPAAPPRRGPARASALEHGLFDDAHGGAEANAAGARRLDEAHWIDRANHLARIPIDRALDAVVADPSLISGTP